MEYILKVSRLGSKAVIDGIGLGDDKRTSFDIAVKDYISEGNLPATPLDDSTSSEASIQKIQDVFISAGRLSDLGTLLKLQVIQKLAPGIQKEGYEESQQTAESSTRQEPREPFPREPETPAYDPLRHEPPPARPYPFQDPNVANPRRPYPPGLEPPGFDDEYDILRGPRGGLPGARNPLNIGHDDLYPPGLGPNDPFRGSGGLGGGGSGMHPNFDDPLFGGRGGAGAGQRGDPQVPDGARYDPVHPGDPRGGQVLDIGDREVDRRIRLVGLGMEISSKGDGLWLVQHFIYSLAHQLAGIESGNGVLVGSVSVKIFVQKTGYV
jgi:hypothetical protein